MDQKLDLFINDMAYLNKQLRDDIKEQKKQFKIGINF